MPAQGPLSQGGKLRSWKFPPEDMEGSVCSVYEVPHAVENPPTVSTGAKGRTCLQSESMGTASAVASALMSRDPIPSARAKMVVIGFPEEASRCTTTLTL